jgi:hypothetical protein
MENGVAACRANLSFDKENRNGRKGCSKEIGNSRRKREVNHAATLVHLGTEVEDCACKTR